MICYRCTEKNNFDIIGFLDADLATPLEEVERIVAVFNENNKFTQIAKLKLLFYIDEQDLKSLIFESEILELKIRG